jgi:hypothetical protein
MNTPEKASRGQPRYPERQPITSAIRTTGGKEEPAMTVVLNHTIDPVANKHRGARPFADLHAADTTMESGPFVAVRVNDVRHGPREYPSALSRNRV